MSPGPRHTSVPSEILIHPAGHNRHGSKRGGLLWERTVFSGPRFTSAPSGIFIHPAVCPQYKGQKVGGGLLCPHFEWGVLGPSNTMPPGPRPACISSFILIHPTIHQHYRQDRQTDNRLSNRILRTILQPVAQKLKPSLIASYDIRPGNGEGLFWFPCFINLSLT